MFEKKKLKNWSNLYWAHITRNIGLVKIDEQEKLKNTPIVIFGLGGLGGPIIEMLARIGCEKLNMCDNDKFEVSNLNRQLCTREDIGKFKIDFIENYLIKINPEIEINKYYEINERNISNILNKASIAVLTLDDPVISILISRECFKAKIPMIESWAIPYLCAWWFTSENIDYETCYGFKTHGRSIEEIKNSEETIIDIKKSIFFKLMKFPGIKEVYDREKGALEGMISGKLPNMSLAPIVRLTASYISFEIVFSGILGVKKKILAPKISGYDYLRMKSIEFSFK